LTLFAEQELCYKKRYLWDIAFTDLTLVLKWSIIQLKILHGLNRSTPEEPTQYTRIELGDATTHTWEKEISLVACETYLGSPISMMPNQEKLQKLLEETNVLHKKMLQNLAGQIKPGTRLCLAVPAWRVKNGFASLPTLDLLAKIGYNRIDFKLASQADLIYIRDNQFVGRELVVLEKS
jgi:hypothetical protein